MTDEDLWGEFWCLPEPQIRVNKELPGYIKALTIFHEVLECLAEIYGLNLSESSIRTLEMSLANLINSNRKEFREWFEMLEKGLEERDDFGEKI
tara:strand:+ start:2151 stop:2432 length:282 start_codon:yes stop_codon:yes gene_type:complete